MNHKPQTETTISGVAEAALYVADLARAVAFYHEVLGLPITMQFADAAFLQTGAQSTLILFDREALRTRTSTIPGHGAEGPMHVALAIAPEQMAAWRARLQAHGVAIEHEQTWPAGTHSLYFRDPDGHSLELIDGSHYPKLWMKIGTTSS
ncbi:MAG: VOC family protein [Anaerolineales bacterium]|nr:VOC family protein [Anaerolineales bacterium]